MKRITRVAFLLILSSCAVAMSSDLFAQPSDLPPLVDGRTNPELIDDSIAMDNFINLILELEGGTAGAGNAYLNRALGAVNQDFNELIESFAEYLGSNDETAATSEFQVICNDTARLSAMSNYELLETFTQIQEADKVVSRDKLRSDATRLLGQDKYDQLIKFIETDIKPTMKMSYSENFSDYPEETLNKLDRAFILGLGCK